MIDYGRLQNHSVTAVLLLYGDKMPQNMRYFVFLFGGSALFQYLCRRICDVNRCIMLHKVGMHYVYTRKR